MNVNLNPFAGTIKGAIQSAINHTQKEAKSSPGKIYKSILATNIKSHLQQVNLKIPSLLQNIGV